MRHRQSQKRWGLPAWSLGSWMGVGAIAAVVVLQPAARATIVSGWMFNPMSEELSVALPAEVKPRFLVFAEPARIVLEIPNMQLGQGDFEQDYHGDVRRIQVTQYDPNTVRMTLVLAPNAVLDPHHAELTAIAEGGQTRWVLRPLVVHSGAIAAAPATPEGAPETGPATAAAAEAPIAEIPSPVVPPSPATAGTRSSDAAAGGLSTSAANLMLSAPTADLDRLPDTLAIDPFGPAAAPVSVPPLEASRPPVSVPPLPADPVSGSTPPGSGTVAQVPASASAPTAPVANTPPAVPTPARNPIPEMASGAASEVASGADPGGTAAPATTPPAVAAPGLITVPPPGAIAPELPSSPGPESPAPAADLALAPPAAVAIAVEPPPASAPAVAPEVAPEVAPAVPPAVAPAVAPEVAPAVPPAVAPAVPPASVSVPETPPFLEPGAIAGGVPSPVPVAPPAVVTQLPPTAGTIPATAYPPPVAFGTEQTLPVPTVPAPGSDNRELALVPPGLPAAAPPVGAPVGAIAFGQPLPTAGVKSLEPDPSGALNRDPAMVPPRPIAPDVLLPVGTVLRLRYSGQDPLTLDNATSVDEVLVLAEDLRDARTNAIIAPAGSQIAGKFEPDVNGQRWVSETLILPGRQIALASASDYMVGPPEVSGGSLALNTGIGALALTVLTGFTGIGLLGGAVLGATTAVGMAPQHFTIEPNQIIQVQVLEDVPRSALQLP